MWPWYQDVCAGALEKLGCEVVRFGWFDDFRHWREGYSEPFYHSLWHRIQYRLHTGPAVWRVYRRLKRVAVSVQPDIIWFYNVQLIAPNVVKELKQTLPTATFVQYANDNPFSSAAKPWLWRNYLNSIPLFDVHFSYRLNNIANYQLAGAQSTYLLRSYFIPEEDFHVPESEIPDRFKCDVVFAGHYEDDGRVEMLEAICQEGYRLNLFGGGWSAALPKLQADSPLRALYPISPVTKADYRYAICGAKVALCFLSTLNHDTYTRRNFQIPAMKVAMLSQCTDDLTTLYAPDKEAVFFRDKQELIAKLAKLLNDDTWRKSVAEAGYAKVYFAGHDVTNRMKVWLDYLRQFRI
ncbi:glycosyltransferase [Polynucleobacter sp. MWH-Loch1C5]|uniref:CgeB family protein n=1 Tax=Polynucleobacter sp. MWH-Loch1C5 TaxID=2689108 RepID=UPI001C0C0249|nr:glycosyltransferase [Polynucleobacter sp. MWH-Loch1C5]MBU3542206.1 glycosyltransferase [Polynucleobacter sp. MWH-Loch1C5]